ncbi:hypothetical protein V9T40_009780 [Parthenolecanium corni]|uniref:Uncharacterized protein n=1 Tax=Parthenolecanium corni TaxID=536013 RepID=A0AAN9TSR2_9HEMI
MIAVRQKPRRNDGSTMSTTSPSSGCFSVALLLLTIFLDSLRASKYCSVQIVQSKRCRSRNAIRRTYRNVPDRPYGQTQQTYTNRVRERAGFNMRDSTAGSAARLVVRRRRKSISSGVYRAAFFEASSRCTVTSACRSFPLVTGERAASGRARSSFADARRRYFSCRAAVSAGSFRARSSLVASPPRSDVVGGIDARARERACERQSRTRRESHVQCDNRLRRACARRAPRFAQPRTPRRGAESGRLERAYDASYLARRGARPHARTRTACASRVTFAAHTDANKVASFERFAIVDVNAFAVYRHAVECDERTPPNPREYPYSPGVSATYVSKTKVERNLCRGRKQPRSAYALSRSSTAAGDDDIFTHLALARTPLSRRADERRAIYPADRSGRGRRSTANVVRVFGVAARSLRRCATYPPALVSSSSSSDARECTSSGSGRAYSASYRCERRRADTFARSVARTYPATRTRSDERTVSRKSTSLPGSADVRVCTHTRTLVKKVTRPGGRVDSSESRARRSSPFVGGGLEGALSAARRSTERRPVADRVSHESTSVLWLILPVVICLSQRLSHACLNRTHVTWITVVILELIHADRAPTSASSFGGSPVVVGRSEGALLLDQNRPSVSTALRARVEPAAVIPAPIAYIKVVAVKKLVVGSVSSRRRTTERGRLASRLAFLQVIVPGVSAGRPAGRRIRAVVVGRVRSARASTAARLGAPGLSFRRWRRALGTSETRPPSKYCPRRRRVTASAWRVRAARAGRHVYFEQIRVLKAGSIVAGRALRARLRGASVRGLPVGAPRSRPRRPLLPSGVRRSPAGVTQRRFRSTPAVGRFSGPEVMINRDRRGHSYRDVRGEILGSSRDEPKRKHLPSMFSSDQERKLEVRRRSDTALVLTVNDAS